MIQLQKVTKIYEPDTVALREITFKVKEGEFLIVSGRSGAGKTTLLKLILAEEKPTRGRILISGENIHHLPPKKIPALRRKMGAIFQDYKLLPKKTVFENISFVLKAIGASEEEIEESIPRVLRIVGIERKKDRFPHELSSGEKQRASIARALVHRPNLILADEPTGNLDPANTFEIISLLEKINDLGTTVILATHSQDIIKHLKKRTILIKDGDLVRDAKEGKILI